MLTCHGFGVFFRVMSISVPVPFLGCQQVVCYRFCLHHFKYLPSAQSPVAWDPAWFGENGCVLWILRSAGKLERAGNHKSYQERGFSKALYGSFCRAAGGIVCRAVEPVCD